MKRVVNAAIASVVAFGLVAGTVGCNKQPAQPMFDENVASICIEDIDREDIGNTPVPVMPNPQPTEVCVLDDDRGNTAEALTRQQVEAKYGADMWVWYAAAWTEAQKVVNDDGYISNFDSSDLFMVLLLAHLLAWNYNGQLMSLYDFDGHKWHKSHKPHKVKSHPAPKKPAAAALPKPAQKPSATNAPSATRKAPAGSSSSGGTKKSSGSSSSGGKRK